MSADPFEGCAGEYDAALERGLRLSGEGREHFSRRRVEAVARELGRRGAAPSVRRVLDYGCGDGLTALHLREAFPSAEVLGADVSPAMVREAQRRASNGSLRFEALGSAPLPEGAFDLAYAANVFHHVEPALRVEVLRGILGALRPGGHLALFENNPWNPGARAVMARVPFDRGAVPLSPLDAARAVREAGFSLLRLRSLFYFPRLLKALRPLEPLLGLAPFGAQCFLLARRDSP